MEMIKTLDVPRRFIFDKIVESSLMDIEQQTGKKLKTSKMNGFEYSKKFANGSTARIKLTDNEEPSVYEFTTTQSKRKYTTRWELHPIDDTSTDVIISEEQTANGFLQKANDAIMGIGLGWLKKRQMTAILDSISKAYHG